MRSSWPLVIVLSLVWGTPMAQSGQPVEPRIVEHGRRDSNMIALTFDACPTSREDEYDERVIAVLVREGVPATLFLSGMWVERNEEQVKALTANPLFELGNHAYWHPHMLEKDDERVLRELKRTQDSIRKVTGKRPLYFRPPFGEVDERLARLAAKAGLLTVQYDIASGDPDSGLSAMRIARGVVEEAKGGSIVVFHMNENGARTAEALPAVIKGLREKGFQLVTVGTLLKQEQEPYRGDIPDRTSRGQAEAQRRSGKRQIGNAGFVSAPAASAASASAVSIATSTIETSSALNTSGEETARRK